MAGLNLSRPENFEEASIEVPTPDEISVPNPEAGNANNNTAQAAPKNYIKNDDSAVEERKLFQNKKANIALITVTIILCIFFIWVKFF